MQGMFTANLSLSYISDNATHVERVPEMVGAPERGYRSKINYNHIDYLNISQKPAQHGKSN